MWKHKKYKNEFKGSYRFSSGEREFILTGIVSDKVRNISFESHQAAKSLGWKKCK